MKQLIYIASATALLWGCTQTKESVSSNPSTQPISVDLQLVPEHLHVLTRATDESAIKDVNFYLYGTTNGTIIHTYTQSPTLRFECLPGKYNLYVAANIHADMGDKRPSELAACMSSYHSSHADLPMSVTTQIEVPADGHSVVHLPAVEVRRTVAKISYNIAIGKAVSDIHLSSVRFYNIPRQTPLFGEAEPATSDASYTTSDATTITDPARYCGVLYMPENCQGTVPGITSQQQKNRHNAPEYATYMMIRATRGGKVLDYTVYLGQNNSDDFNVRRNSSHTLDITILGDNEIDTRVHSYAISVSDNFYEMTYGDYCTVGKDRSLIVTVEGNRESMSLYGSLEIISGDSNSFDFNGDSGLYHEFVLDELQGSNYYGFSYIPRLVTKDNSRLQYLVTIWDDYDFWQSFEIEHQFANSVNVYVKSKNIANGNGSISVSKALHWEKDLTENIQALCYKEGCTFTATPAAGCEFAGWFADCEFTRLLSATATYDYRPTEPFGTLFAKFEQGNVLIQADIYDVDFACNNPYVVDYNMEGFSVPAGSICTITVKPENIHFAGWYDSWNPQSRKLLSTERAYTFTATENRIVAIGTKPLVNLSAAGTANCYIAPQNGIYSINARVMGNNKATTGITPKALNGSKAEVIWETGSTRGGIIREASYIANTGIIVFSTGEDAGNAMIALFDQNNVCIWSWHIWVTNGNPTVYTQYYTGGRTFMDRNIGALSNSITDPSFRGLYYQWGRKDPFMYPYNQTSQNRGFITYHPDYQYDLTDPIMGYGEMTLAYAIAHPWTFMCGIYINDDRENDTQNWVTPQNPNLWGNPSTIYNLVDGGSKSIYDPCPPGWRVPDRKAWAEAKMTYVEKKSNYCYNLKTAYIIVSLPLSGYIFEGNYAFNGVDCLLWTNAPFQYNQTTTYWKSYSTGLYIAGSNPNPMNGFTRDRGIPVRCMKE